MHRQPHRSNIVHFLAPLLVAVFAFVFLGGSLGTSSLFASLGDFQPSVQDASKDIQGAGRPKSDNAVAAILSHWEYTGHCGPVGGTPGGTGGCPTTCGLQTSGACGDNVLVGCCTGFDQGATCPTQCVGCCVGAGDYR